MAGLNDVRDTARLYTNRYTIEETAEHVSKDILNSIKGLHRLIIEHSETDTVNDTLAVRTIFHVPAI